MAAATTEIPTVSAANLPVQEQQPDRLDAGIQKRQEIFRSADAISIVGI